MPYKDLKSISPSLAGITPPISLGQANEIAAAADAMMKADVKGSPYAFAITNFKKKYVVRNGKWELREPEAGATKEAEPVAEAATYKAAALRLARDMAALLADRSVPAALRKEVEDVRAMLKRTWADLEAEADGKEQPTKEEPPAEDTTTEDEEPEVEETDPNTALLARTFVTVSSGEHVSLADCVAAYEAKQEPVVEVARPKNNSKHKHEITPPPPAPGKAREWATHLGTLLAEVMIYLREQADVPAEAVPDVGSEPIAESAVPIKADESISDPTAEGVPAPVAESIVYEDESDKEVSLAEATITETESGHVLDLAETALGVWDGQGPLKLRTVLIEAGPGNRRDGHYYPAEMLDRCAPMFAGKKMYATDHKDSERSVRSEVADILRCPVGRTDKGGIIAEVGIFDPDFARKAWNRAQMGTLQNLAVSIVGAGKTRKGMVDGQRYDVVTDITEGAADFVTAAGAGGRALAIAEVAAKPEPQKEQHMLTGEEVKTILGARAGVGDTMLARLSEREYEDTEAVEAAVVSELAYIAAVTGAGKPVGLNEVANPVQPKRPSIEEYNTAVERIINNALGRH